MEGRVRDGRGRTWLESTLPASSMVWRWCAALWIAAIRWPSNLRPEMPDDGQRQPARRIGCGCRRGRPCGPVALLPEPSQERGLANTREADYHQPVAVRPVPRPPDLDQFAVPSGQRPCRCRRSVDVGHGSSAPGRQRPGRRGRVHSVHRQRTRLSPGGQRNGRGAGPMNWRQHKACSGSRRTVPGPRLPHRRSLCLKWHGGHGNPTVHAGRSGAESWQSPIRRVASVRSSLLRWRWGPREPAVGRCWDPSARQATIGMPAAVTDSTRGE